MRTLEGQRERAADRSGAADEDVSPWAGIAHQRFDFRHSLGRFGGDHFAGVARHDHVVFDADADVAQPLRHVVGRADVEPRLDRERHAGLERAPLPGGLVFARVVHVEAEPVSRAVHVEALVGFFFQDLLKPRF
jgi:hypothetical protein